MLKENAENGTFSLILVSEATWTAPHCYCYVALGWPWKLSTVTVCFPHKCNKKKGGKSLTGEEERYQQCEQPGQCHSHHGTPSGSPIFTHHGRLCLQVLQELDSLAGGSLPWTCIVPQWTSRQYIIAQDPVPTNNLEGCPCVLSAVWVPFLRVEKS